MCTNLVIGKLVLLLILAGWLELIWLLLDLVWSGSSTVLAAIGFGWLERRRRNCRRCGIAFIGLLIAAAVLLVILLELLEQPELQSNGRLVAIGIGIDYWFGSGKLVLVLIGIELELQGFELVSNCCCIGIGIGS